MDSFIKSSLFRQIGIGIFLLGLILVAIGVSRYFAYSTHDEKQFAVVKCTLSEVVEQDQGTSVTFVYSYKGKEYTKTEISEAFTDLNFQEGQVLDLWVDASNPNEAVLPILKPQVQAWGLRYAGMGLVLVLVAAVLWRISR